MDAGRSRCFVPERSRRFVVAQLGARMHYAVPEILLGAGLLEAFHTDLVAPRDDDLLSRLLGPTKFRRRYRGRVVSEALRARTVQHRLTGLAQLAALRAVRSERLRRKVYLAGGRAFCRSVVRHGFEDANAVYGATSASLEIFAAARASGMGCVLEQYIAAQPFCDRVLQKERAAFGDWDPGGPAVVHDPRSEDRVRSEWAAADLVLCPSEFVRESLVREGVDEEKLILVPYGVPRPTPARRRTRAGPASGPLRVLFVGTVELRKGVHVLYEAARTLPPGTAELRVIGPLRLSRSGAARMAEVGEVLGQVPRSEMERHFEWADVLVLPSLLEGSATVTYEALVRGLPVICTPNAGSIVMHEETGLLVPPRDPARLAEAIRGLAEDRDRFELMAESAWRHRERASFGTYATNLLAALGAADGAAPATVAQA